MITALVGYGLARVFVLDDIGTVPFDKEAFEGTAYSAGTLGIFLILKGFSSGAVALTGVEAISNGVPAFRRPESKNAAATLVWMAVILGVLFLGVSVLAQQLEPYPSHDQTVLAQMGLLVFGNGAVFFVLQIATALILTLAANTAYADFPRLSSIIARDGYLPRQMANRGDRLVFSNGVLLLAGAAALLLIAFGGLTNALIPLYAVGVFTSFTLSQAGMVRHHQKVRDEGWKRHAVINGVGAAATLVVLIIVATTKFTSGAWVPIVVVPAIILLFKGIHRHYTRVDATLRTAPGRAGPAVEQHGRGPRRARAQGRAPGAPVRQVAQPEAISSPSASSPTRKRTPRSDASGPSTAIDVPLETVYSPYRELHKPLTALHRRARRSLRQRRRHDRHPGVRRAPLVGTLAPQPERALPEGAAAVPQGHGGHLRAVPRRLTTNADTTNG